MNSTQFNMAISFCLFFVAILLVGAHSVFAQAVCLPAPRLMTTYPMGAQAGTTVSLSIVGQNAEEIHGMIFSHPGVEAHPVTQNGVLQSGKFEVTVASDVPHGIYEARLITRLGVSTARAFSVTHLPELIRKQPNTTVEKAMPIDLNSICNSYTTRQAIDYYRFSAKQGEKVVVECAATRIDSKLKPVVIIGDEQGADLLVERRGGKLEFNPPRNGKYTIKVHDLTYQGGQEYFYRLVVQTRTMPGEQVMSHPATRDVNEFSWPAFDNQSTTSTKKSIAEIESGNEESQIQSIQLPCRIDGRFYPAADVDTFEFDVRKGETWWVEVVSERIGRPTDPAVVVQHVSSTQGEEKITEVAELNDILSPVKISSNGYSYDGPPYNAGSADIIGSFTAKQDGKHRLQITDLFGGTRSDLRNRYQLIIRRAEPDFALVGWSLHMNLRNGDRNALSKPLALRRGAAMIVEVVAVRRDGFQGPIELSADNLPAGVSAAGVRIPAGQTRGYLVLSADSKAPSGYSLASLTGTAVVNGQTVTRPCQWASMRWPVTNAWSEIPRPRLVANVPVSVTESEYAPLSLRANEEKIWEVKANSQLKIPLVQTKSCDFSGPSITLKTLGSRFQRNPAFDAALNAEMTEATIDLAKTKVPPGTYQIVFYGSAVAKYSAYPQGVGKAEAEVNRLEKKLAQLQSGSTPANQDQVPTKETKETLDQAKMINDIKLAIVAAKKKLAAAKIKSKTKDIVDIVVSKPIQIKVIPANKESKP